MTADSAIGPISITSLFYSGLDMDVALDAPNHKRCGLPNAPGALSHGGVRAVHDGRVEEVAFFAACICRERGSRDKKEGRPNSRP